MSTVRVVPSHHRVVLYGSALNLLIGLVAVVAWGSGTAQHVTSDGTVPPDRPPEETQPAPFEPSEGWMGTSPTTGAPDPEAPATDATTPQGPGSAGGGSTDVAPRGTVVSPETTTTEAPSGRAPAGPGLVSLLPEGDVGPGPHDLLGRVVYTVEVGQVGSDTWSMRPDGTDRRRELDCPAPEVPPPSPQPDHYWLTETTSLSLSPDGRFLARSCLARAATVREYENGGLAYGLYDIVIQDVDRSGVSVIGRYDSRFGHRFASWSQDGQRLAISSPDGIEIVHLDGSGRRSVPLQRPLEFQRGRLTSPEPFVWSPDGRRLAWGLSIVDIATGSVRSASDWAVSPWPSTAAMGAWPVLRWDDRGLWAQMSFIPADMSAFRTQDTYGIYHLNPTTGVVTRVRPLTQTYSPLAWIGAALVGEDSGGGYTFIDDRGVAHEVTDLEVADMTVATHR